LRRKTLASITFVTIVAMLSAGLFAGVLGTMQNPKPAAVVGDGKLVFDNCVATKNPDNLDIAFTVRCTTIEGKAVDGFKLNGVANDELPGLIGYLNGTAFESGYSPLLVMMKGDSLNVELVLPSAFSGQEFNSGVVNVAVITPNQLYGIDAYYS
jgi:hypothetical protein